MQIFRLLDVLEEGTLLCVSIASFKESWRTTLNPEWSLGDFRNDLLYVNTYQTVCLETCLWSVGRTGCPAKTKYFEVLYPVRVGQKS